MTSILENLSSLTINRITQNLRPNLVPRKTLLTHDILKGKGFYNGKIMMCTSYKKQGKYVIADCTGFDFFDLLLCRFDKKPFPLVVSTNGIIEVGDNGFILMERDRSVYSYKFYWDFPAGLVPFDRNPLDRLTERIRDEIGIDKEHLKPNPNPIFIEIQKEPFGYFFAIYYHYKCNLSKLEVKKLFKKNSNIKKIILNKNSVNEFLSKKKKIYPRNILRKLST